MLPRMMTLRLSAVATAMTALAVAAATGCKAGPADGGRNREKPAAPPDPPAARARGAAPAAAARVVAPTPKAARAESWNAAQIHWLDYDQGIAVAKTQHKPVCLVFFATWCPHCKNYSHVFEDPRVVAEAKKFAMIRIDTDREPAVASRYALDGSYIPRTYFLTPSGEIARTVKAPRTRFQFFYNEHDPASLLGGMQQAEKLVD